MTNFTPAEARNFFQTKHVTFTLGDIQCEKRKGGRTIWIDNRTERKLYPDESNVLPIAVDEHRTFVICPHCQSFHVHGNDLIGQAEGHRVSDCPEGGGYYIKSLPAAE